MEKVSPTGNLTIRLEKNRRLEYSPREHRHFDHGYTMTSHSARGVTADRVLNGDAKMHPNLVNSRFANVAISRARNDAMIYSDDSAGIEAKLGNDVSKSAAACGAEKLVIQSLPTSVIDGNEAIEMEQKVG